MLLSHSIPFISAINDNNRIIPILTWLYEINWLIKLSKVSLESLIQSLISPDDAFIFNKAYFMISLIMMEFVSRTLIIFKHYSLVLRIRYKLLILRSLLSGLNSCLRETLRWQILLGHHMHVTIQWFLEERIHIGSWILAELIIRTIFSGALIIFVSWLSSIWKNSVFMILYLSFYTAEFMIIGVDNLSTHYLSFLFGTLNQDWKLIINVNIYYLFLL